MAEQHALSRNAIISQLNHSPHGKLEFYKDIFQKAAAEDPAFVAHLIAWNYVRGTIRDSKVGIPTVSLSVPSFAAMPEFAENSLAHLGMMGPRELLKAHRFSLGLRPEIAADASMAVRTSQPPRGGERMQRLISAYLRKREDHEGWDRVALQHRHTLRELYGLARIRPEPERANIIIYGTKHGKVDGKYVKAEVPSDSVFAVVAKLGQMEPREAAGAILGWKIPFLVAQGALGKRAKDQDVALAMIDRMTPTELVTHTKMLEKWGIRTVPAVRSAYEDALKRRSKSTGATHNVLKTTMAADALEEEDVVDVALVQKLRDVQEKQIQQMKGIEGNWLVLADASGSMQQTMEIARQVAAVLAKMVKGKVWLTFFAVLPHTVDVTGCSLDIIQKATKHIVANGGTSIGCGLQRMLDENTEVDGIAIVSDAKENTSPWFYDVYGRYSRKFDKQVPVYLYRTPATGGSYQDRDLRNTMSESRFDLQEFDLTKGLDLYSLPNLVQTMRASRYSLIDEILSMPLLTLNEIFPNYGKKGEMAYANS